MSATQDFSAGESYGDMGNSSFADLAGQGPDALGQSFASTFRNRGTAMTTEEMRRARETRAAEAMRMKDEQLRILSENNATLLNTLNQVEEEANTIQLEKIAVEQENKTLRDTNFELQSKAKSAETVAKRVQMEVADKDKQLRIMTDQNAELLRLLESEESVTAQLQGEVAELRAELDEIRQKYAALLTTAKTHEELATKAAKEGQLRAEEIRLLRVEVEQLKQQNTELKMKTQIEVEALQEQLRVRKEKQYQILEKLQAQEQAQRQAQDQVAGMEEQLRALHARNLDLETQNKVESRNKSNIEEANKELQTENTSLFNQTKELQQKIERAERERLRMEAEARASGEQLQDTSAKLFQLLERLKLAELGKTKALDALKKKEQDLVALQKKNARLIHETAEEGKARVKVEMDNKVLAEQVRALKKNNTALAQKAKDEALGRAKASEERDALDEKLKTMEARLSFLLNKVQADEESRLVQAEERKKLEAQVVSGAERQSELQQKVSELHESNRVVSQALRLKQDELNHLQNQYEHALQQLQQRETEIAQLTGGNDPEGGATADEGNRDKDGNAPDDIENVRKNEGRGRFYVEAKSVGGGSLLLLKGRKPQYRDYLDKHGVNEFLRKSQKTTRFRDLIVEKLAAVYGLLMVEEEEKQELLTQIAQRDTHLSNQQRKLALLQETLAVEEDAKRQMLFRYIQAVKDHALDTQTNMGNGSGILQLPEAKLGDEEVHALAALLRHNTSIEEAHLRGNHITDDGAKALAAVLSSSKTALRLIDLRGNRISRVGIQTLAEALERQDRVRHVYVHAGGKIEALGASSVLHGTTTTVGTTAGAQGQTWAQPRPGAGAGGTVETVCVVDVRDNHPENNQALPFDALPDSTGGVGQTGQGQTGQGGFQPRQLLQNSSHNGGTDTTTKGHSNKGTKKTQKLLSSQSTSQLLLRPRSATSSPQRDRDTQPHQQPGKDNKQRLIQQYQEQLQQLRESGWQGRSEGLDISRSWSLALPPPLSVSSDQGGGGIGSGGGSGGGNNSNPSSKKKKVRALPPLSHSTEQQQQESGNRPSSRPPRLLDPLSATSEAVLLRTADLLPSDSHNNNNNNHATDEEESEEEVEREGGAEGSAKKKRKGKKKKRLSETARRLESSPFLQPLVKS